MKNRKLNINTILNNPFSKSLMDEVHISLTSLPERKGFAFCQNNHHLLSEKEKKLSRISKLDANLVTIINDLSIVYILINRRPVLSYLNKHHISETDYIKYHFEVFIHKIHTIHEIMKLMVNEIYDINLPYKKCKWENLIKHSMFKSSETMTIMADFYKEFNQLIENRHLNTHQGMFNDKEMDKVNESYFIYHQYERLNLPMDDEFKRMVPYWWVKLNLKEFKKMKLKQILDLEQSVLNYCSKFFNSLQFNATEYIEESISYSE